MYLEAIKRPLGGTTNAKDRRECCLDAYSNAIKRSRPWWPWGGPKPSVSPASFQIDRCAIPYIVQPVLHAQWAQHREWQRRCGDSFTVVRQSLLRGQNRC